MKDATMDAGPSYASPPQLSSTSGTYSDADSEFASDEYEIEVDGNPQDGVYVESRAAASDYSDEYEEEVPVGKGKARTTFDSDVKPSRYRARVKKTVHKVEKKPRSWSDLDVSMIIALLSPVGNWLTGSDHVKNLFLLILLVFYLHQLIEVPWRLYKSSRARISPRHALKIEEATDLTSKAARLALSELHYLELVYLSCTVIAPFVGAVLIRYVFSAMNGVDSLSWFSTTLFVLATGIRPWSHLISRLHERSSELQDVAGEPERLEQERQNERKLRDFEGRLETVERVVAELRSKTAKITPLQEACDDLSEALGDMERSVIRHERKVEAARVAHGSRLSAMEHTIVKLEESQRKALVPRPLPGQGVVGLYIPVHPLLAQALSWALELPQRLHDSALLYLASNIPERAIHQQSKLENSTSSPTLVTPAQSQSDSLHYFNGTPLETIPEADDSDSDGTFVSERHPLLSSPLSPLAERSKGTGRVRSRSRSHSHSGPRLSAYKPKSRGRTALDWAAAIVSWPYRCAMRILIIITPSPIQKLFA